ncbi:hypothetical protein Tco_0458522 [Tanacetum coccineum]
MAQQQHATDVHPDELCPPNKRYDLMDANKKVDLEHAQCPLESKILTNIIKNHPLRFSIAAFSSVPWIYMAQFWHTLKEDGSKYRLKFMLDKKELSLTLDDFRTIFHLPNENDNNHNSFVPPPSFSDMVPFYKQQLGFTMELKTSSSFKTTGLLQPWQTLCKIFSKCLTTHVTGWDQPSLQIMQMMYCFVNNIYVDYAELLWEGLFYSLHHPTSSFRRHKDKVGMQIPDWMITKEMKHTEHYRMYTEVFGLDVPLTQSQPNESTQGIHKTPSAPRRSTRLTPPVLSDKESSEAERTNDEEVEVTNVVIHVNVNEEEDEITDEVYELKRREKGKVVKDSRSTPLPIPIRSPRTHTHLGWYTYLFEHLKERFLSRNSFDTLADHLQEVMVESLPTMVDTHIKEQVKKQVPERVRDQVPVYVAEGLILERQKTKEEMEWMIAKAILQDYMFGHILHVHPAQTRTLSVPEQQNQLYLSMKDNPQLQQQDIAIWLDDCHDDAHPEGENSSKRQKTSEYEAYMSGESSSGQVNKEERGPSTSGNQEQEDDYDFCTDSYALDDDEIPTKQVSQDIMEEVSLTIDEESRKKILVSPHPGKTTPLVQSCQRDPEAPALSLINQDLLYLKKGSLGPKKSYCHFTSFQQSSPCNISMKMILKNELF